MARPKQSATTLSRARPRRAAAALRTKTTGDIATIAPDSAARMPPARPVRHTRASKNIVLSPSQPPDQLLPTFTPTQLPLPLKRPTPTPSDMDVGRLIGGDEYEVANAQHQLYPVQPGDWSATTSWDQFPLPVDTIDQDTQNALDTTDSLCPALHPPHPLHLVTPLSPEPPASEDLGSEGPDGSSGVILKGTGMAGNIDHVPPSDVIVITDMDNVPSTSSTYTVPMESESTKPLTLTPGMEAEVVEWLKTIGGAWVHSQEQKHGVPADVWLAKIHHLTRQHAKSGGGLNTWNTYQKWWKHCHPEAARPLGSDDRVRRENTERIMSEYHKKMEELGTHEARDNWCVQVEQQLGCSTERKEDDAPPGLLRVRKLENDILNVIVPAILSKIYVFAGIIPANPRDPIARAASCIIVNDKLVSDVLNEEGTDVQVLFSNLELGVRNHLRKQAGELPLLKGDKVNFNTTFQLKKAAASEVDRFDVSNKPSPWCDIELEASQAMVALLKQVPVQSTRWKATTNRLPEPWWQFAHLLFHRDPGLNELSAERDKIIHIFRQYVLLMTHDPVRKNGARALALIDAAIQGTELTLSRHVRTEYRSWGKKLVENDNVIGNWPGKVATATIPIRSKTIGDALADDYRAILLAILEEKEEQRLYVGKRPEGVDWLVKRVDGECVLCSEYWPEHDALPYSAAPPRSPTVSIVFSPTAKPVCRKRKGHSKSVPVIHDPNTAIAHTPLDLQPIKELFNQDTADDTATNISTNHHHFLASEDLNYQLDVNLLPLTPTLPHPKTRKRPAHVLGKQNGASHPKRLKTSDGLLPSDIDIVSSGESSILALSTPLRSIPLATQSMATSISATLSQPPMDDLQLLPLLQPVYHQGTLIPHEDVPTTTSHQSSMSAPSKPSTVIHPVASNLAGSSAVPPPTALASIPPHQPGTVPPTRFSVPGPLPFPPFPPYGYNMPFPPVPPVIHGTSMMTGYPPSHAQMPSPAYHPMMGYYLPGYGQQPPPMQ